MISQKWNYRTSKELFEDLYQAEGIDEINRNFQEKVEKGVKLKKHKIQNKSAKIKKIMELLEKGKAAKNLKEEYIKEFSKNF